MVGAKNDGPHQSPHNDEQAAFRYEAWQPVVEVETWGRTEATVSCLPLRPQEMVPKGSPTMQMALAPAGRTPRVVGPGHGGSLHRTTCFTCQPSTGCGISVLGSSPPFVLPVPPFDRAEPWREEERSGCACLCSCKTTALKAHAASFLLPDPQLVPN